MDRRPDHPTVRIDLVGDRRIAIIRGRLETAELFLRVIDEDRKQNLALVGGDQGPIVGEELRANRGDEQDKKDPERPVAAAVAAEVFKPAPVHRGERETWRFHTSVGGDRTFFVVAREGERSGGHGDPPGLLGRRPIICASTRRVALRPSSRATAEQSRLSRSWRLLVWIASLCSR